MATTFTTTHSVTTKIDSNMIVDSTDTHVAYLRYDKGQLDWHTERASLGETSA